MDYLKVTVFKGFTEVRSIVEAVLLENCGLSLESWEEKGPVGRWENLLVGAGVVTLYNPKDTSAGYCMVELKGDGCAVFGPHRLQAFLQALEDAGRWHAVRVDGAWDHVAFGPAEVYGAARAGNTNLKRPDITKPEWWESPEGRTAYIGRHGQPRMLRVYDMRGYNRCELAVKDDWAKHWGRLLRVAPVETWSEWGLAFLRGFVEFVDCSSGLRPDRAEPLPWWKEFVQTAKRISSVPAEVSHNPPLPIGKADAAMQRLARSLLLLADALGWGWVRDRAEHWGRRRVTEQDQETIRQLKRYRGSGLAGTDVEEAEEVPF